MIKEGYGRPKIEIDLAEVELAAEVCRNDTEIAERLSINRNTLVRRKFNDEHFQNAYLRGKAKRNKEQPQSRVVSLVFTSEEYARLQTRAENAKISVQDALKKQISDGTPTIQGRKISRSYYNTIKRMCLAARAARIHYDHTAEACIALLDSLKYGYNADDVDISVFEFAWDDGDFEKWFKGFDLEIVD